jgi:hypothetical protein
MRRAQLLTQRLLGVAFPLVSTDTACIHGEANLPQVGIDLNHPAKTRMLRMHAYKRSQSSIPPERDCDLLYIRVLVYSRITVNDL